MSSIQVEAMKPFKNLAKRENRNMTHFSLPQQPETEQESRSTRSSQTPKHWRPFNRVQEVSRVLSQFALVVKESVNKRGYLASLPQQLGEKKWIRKGRRGTKGRYTNNAQQVSLSEREKMGERGKGKNETFKTTASLQPLSKGKQPCLCPCEVEEES